MLGIAVASCTEAAICGHAGNWEKKMERVSAEGGMRESKARRFPPNPRNTGRGQPGSAPGKLAKICPVQVPATT